MTFTKYLMKINQASAIQLDTPAATPIDGHKQENKIRTENRLLAAPDLAHMKIIMAKQQSVMVLVKIPLKVDAHPRTNLATRL